MKKRKMRWVIIVVVGVMLMLVFPSLVGAVNQFSVLLDFAPTSGTTYGPPTYVQKAAGATEQPGFSVQYAELFTKNRLLSETNQYNATAFHTRTNVIPVDFGLRRDSFGTSNNYQYSGKNRVKPLGILTVSRWERTISEPEEGRTDLADVPGFNKYMTSIPKDPFGSEAVPNLRYYCNGDANTPATRWLLVSNGPDITVEGFRYEYKAEYLFRLNRTRALYLNIPLLTVHTTTVATLWGAGISAPGQEPLSLSIGGQL